MKNFQSRDNVRLIEKNDFFDVLQITPQLDMKYNIKYTHEIYFEEDLLNVIKKIKLLVFLNYLIKIILKINQ